MKKRVYAPSTSSKRTKTSSSKSKAIVKSKFRVNRGPTILPFYDSLGAGPPNMVKVKLRYVENIGMNAGAAGTATQVMRANDMFDPNYSGTGHQPLYFDQIMALYTHFVVLSSKIKVTINPSTASTFIQASIILDDDASGSASNVTLAESKGAKIKMFPYAPTETNRILYHNYSTYKVFGQNPIDNSVLRGSASAGPSEQQYYVVTIFDINGSAISNMVNIEVEYEAVCFELKTVTGS